MRTASRILPLALALPFGIVPTGAGCASTPKPVAPIAPIASGGAASTPTARATSGEGATTFDARDLPPVGEPKPLIPARVLTLDLKARVKAIGIASKNLPIVYLRIVVRAGSATGSIMGTGKSRAGIAEITAQLLKDGGAGRFTGPELADRVDALGADLSVDVGLDRAVFGISVTKDKLDAALEILSTVVLHPRFDAKEFDKLKARELDRVKQSQKGNGGWMARLALYRELYGKGHPYAEVDATDESLTNIELADVKAFYRKAYVAANTFVVAAGDIDAEDLTGKLDRHLKGISTQPPPAVPFGERAPVTGRRVVLALKPAAKQADIFIGALAIPRKDERWPELSLAIQALGGGMSARLFVDVREKRSLAYSTGASLRELANGPSLLSVYAGTQSPSAPQSVRALLENLEAIASNEPIGSGELAIARTSLETGFDFKLETIGSVASLAIDKDVLGLSGNDVYDYVTRYRRALHDASLDRVRAVASEHLKPQSIVIAVAGDAKLAKPLSHFASVRVVDPEKGFATVQQLQLDTSASLDVPK